jgi:MFS family permease
VGYNRATSDTGSRHTKTLINQAKSKYLWYMGGIATYVVPQGIQTILLPWLVAVKLQESADRLGIVQMMTQLPGLFLILLGGLMADRLDARKILTGLHAAAAIPAAVVALFLHTGELTYSLLIVYALSMGVINAFVLPARDGILNRIAGEQLQRTVTVAMGLTFGAQLFGFTAARAADSYGAIPLLLLQSFILLSGVIAAWRLGPMPPRPVEDSAGPKLAQLTRGISVVWNSNIMRPAMLMLTCMSFFYGGTFMVLNPLIVRDIYDGTAIEISLLYSVFVFGTVTSTVLLVMAGGLRRQGRALLLAIIGGGLSLSIGLLEPPFWGFLTSIFLWGMGGGVAMSMSRTIMQENAPDDMRARVLAVFTLSNTGGMPIGALALGYFTEFFGILSALAFVILGVWISSALLWRFSNLSRIGS